MPNNPCDTQLVDRAIRYAVDAHKGTERRAKGFPYVIHPLEAMSIVASITNDPELLAAAALHDVVEDTDITVEEIEKNFGQRIATIVEYESDIVESGKKYSDWRSKKLVAIYRLTYAPMDVKIVAMGDKLSNMRAIAQDFFAIGDKLWSRFHAPKGKIDYAWRYNALSIALSELSYTSAYQEYVRLMDLVFNTNTPVKPVTIDLNDYKETGEGHTSISYSHIFDNNMIKLYHADKPAAIAIREIHYSNKLHELGINTPQALGLVSDGKRIGSNFERIHNKQSFARAISNDGSTLKHYSKLFAELSKELHRKPCDTEFFPSANSLYKGMVAANTALSTTEKENIFKRINEIPDCTTCLHGDLHIGNIITDGSNNWWIDISDFSWGNPLYDIGMTYLIQKALPDSLIQDIFHISLEQMQLSWKIFAKTYFDVESDARLEEINSMVAPFAALRAICLDTVGHISAELLSEAKKLLFS